MIYTSYFANPKLKQSKTSLHFVSVARWPPRWFGKGLDKYPDLYPSLALFEWLREVGPQPITDVRARYMRQTLKKLDPKKVYKDLNGSVILCYEKLPKPCHRHFIASWLNRQIGKTVVEEFDFDGKDRFDFLAEEKIGVI